MELGKIRNNAYWARRIRKRVVDNYLVDPKKHGKYLVEVCVPWQGNPSFVGTLNELLWGIRQNQIELAPVMRFLDQPHCVHRDDDLRVITMDLELW